MVCICVFIHLLFKYFENSRNIQVYCVYYSYDLSREFFNLVSQLIFFPKAKAVPSLLTKA